MRRINFRRYIILTLLFIVLACKADNKAKSNISKNKKVIKGGNMSATISITSSAFKHGDPIPSKYTCQGEDVSPDLKWDKGPEATKSYVLIADDPDAPMGTWVHWVVYNIPATTTSLPEGISLNSKELEGASFGMTDFGFARYGGPCPPPGKPHRYFFKIYAIDTVLNIKKNPTKKEVLEAIKGHILAKGELMGTYKR